MRASVACFGTVARDDYKDPDWVAEIKRRFPAMFEGIGRYDFSCGEGWKSIIARLCTTIAAFDLPELRVVQIKQKLGELRFYVRGGNEAVDDAINTAAAEAERTCEACGALGVNDRHAARGDSGPTKTLCAGCATRNP